MKITKFCLLTLCLVIPLIGISQDANTSENAFKPRLGLGVGTLTFMGDVGDNFSSRNKLVSNIGYNLTLGTPLNNELEFTFNTLFGKLTVHERSNTSNVNFQSEIRGGGIDLKYNFSNLLGTERTFLPYISVGVSSFEFLSKTDLYNGDDQRYHYWSDGSIRDIAQNDPNALNAEIITPDYVYETDLRELNIDGLGDYKDRTISIPVGVGLNMKLNDKADFKIGTQIYFNQTDLIDNVNAETISYKVGDNKNDKFLYTSFSISYNLGVEFSNNRDKMSQDLLALSGDGAEDEDLDGVADIIDRCPLTPLDLEVDEFGCPIDEDNDLVPNYLDKEIGTTAGLEVDEDGVGLTDEYYYRQYMNYSKMATDPNIIEGIVESGDLEIGFAELQKSNENYLAEKARLKQEGKKISIHSREGHFRVLLGVTQAGINSDESQRYLSVPDIESLSFGDSTYYMSKKYDNLEDAVVRQMKLYINEDQGEVVEIRKDQVVRINKDVKAVQDDILRKPEAIGRESLGLTYRVQLGAFKNDRRISLFDEVEDLLVMKGDDGLTRYFSGNFSDVQKAADHSIYMMIDGFKGAFLRAFRNGEGVKLSDAGLEVVEDIDEEKIWNSRSTDAFDKDAVEFRIKLTESEEAIPTRLLNKFIDMGGVETLRVNNMIYYLRGHYKSYDEAKAGVQDAIKKGIIAATIVGDYDGKIIPASEAKDILDN